MPSNVNFIDDAVVFLQHLTYLFDVHSVDQKLNFVESRLDCQILAVAASRYFRNTPLKADFKSYQCTGSVIRCTYVCVRVVESPGTGGTDSC